MITITELSDLKTTRKRCNLIGIFLKPFIKKFQSYTRVSTDFLNKCQRDTNSNSKIVTFDVVSLYTNISHCLGLEAINCFIATYRERLR